MDAQIYQKKSYYLTVSAQFLSKLRTSNTTEQSICNHFSSFLNDNCLDSDHIFLQYLKKWHDLTKRHFIGKHTKSSLFTSKLAERTCHIRLRSTRYIWKFGGRGQPDSHILHIRRAVGYWRGPLPPPPTVCWNGVLRGHFQGIKMQHWHKWLSLLL